MGCLAGMQQEIGVEITMYRPGLDDHCPRCRTRYNNVQRGVTNVYVWMTCDHCGHVGSITFDTADEALQFMRSFGTDSYFERDHGKEATSSY
jgi:hypothetical protein